MATERTNKVRVERFLKGLHARAKIIEAEQARQWRVFTERVRLALIELGVLPKL